jgi:branched-chain amino acid transport system permease protein
VTERWNNLSGAGRAAVGALGAVLLYTLVYALPGTGSFLAEKAPYGIVVTGAVLGTVTSLLAMGLILIYRTNRFINFAYGSMGSFAGVLAIGMHLQHGWPFFLALPVGIAGGVLLGAVIDILVIRRFANSSRLILTVASIGLAQVLGGLELLGSKAIGFLSLTGGFTIPFDIRFDLGVKTLTGDEILSLIVVPPIIAGLAWFLLKTDSGMAVRAAAENADRALLLGIPIRRLSTIVWAVAGGLAALTFVLKAPFSGIAPGVASTGPTVLLPALAAAVVARMESLPVAFAAGIGLGVMEQVVRWNSSGSPSFQNVAFLLVILGALLLQRHKGSRAHETGAASWSATGIVKPVPEQLRHLPEVRWTRLGLLALVALAFVFIPARWDGSDQFLAAIAIVWGITAVSLVILTGWGGHISLGQFAVVGVGSMVAGNIVTRFNTDMFVVLLVAGAAGAVIALLVGLPALRIRGLFLAVTTLALAIALDSYFLNRDNFPTLIPSGVERPFLWQRFDLSSQYALYLVCLAFLGLSIAVARSIRSSRGGRVIIATRDNQRAADAAGVPTTSVKLSAFVLAGALAGIAGGLHVIIVSSIDQGTYAPSLSLDVFSTAVIGGLGSIGGALLGVLLFQWLSTVTALGDFRLLLTGAGLLIVLYALPGGLGSVVLSVRDNLLRRVAERRGILVPSLVADRREDDDKAEDETDLLRGALGGVPAGVGR